MSASIPFSEQSVQPVIDATVGICAMIDDGSTAPASAGIGTHSSVMFAAGARAGALDTAAPGVIERWKISMCVFM